MSELAALRRLAMASPKACARIHRRGGGTDAGIVNVLSDAAALSAIIAAAHRIAPTDVARLTESLITDAPTPDPSPADVEHVQFMQQYG